MVVTSKGFLLFYCTVQRGTLKKLQRNSNNRNHEDHFHLAIIAWTMFQVQFRPYLFMSISESDFNHYYYQSLSSDKTNVSAPWMGEQDFFFPRDIHQCLQVRRKERVKYFSDWFYLIYFKLWYTEEMSQCLASWNYHKKNLSLLSQIMFKLQPDSNVMENQQMKKNGLGVKIWRGKLLKMQSLIMPSFSLHQLIVH